jgi:hypothetical protein
VKHPVESADVSQRGSAPRPARGVGEDWGAAPDPAGGGLSRALPQAPPAPGASPPGPLGECSATGTRLMAQTSGGAGALGGLRGLGKIRWPGGMFEVLRLRWEKPKSIFKKMDFGSGSLCRNGGASRWNRRRSLRLPPAAGCLSREASSGGARAEPWTHAGERCISARNIGRTGRMVGNWRRLRRPRRGWGLGQGSREPSPSGSVNNFSHN